LFADVRVVTEECDLQGPAEAMYPEEAAHVERAVERRRREFAIGRQCARRALARLGITGLPLLAGPDGAPLWPAGLVGSITHTHAGPAGFCGVAVAARQEVAALGIDAEGADSLSPELWEFVLTDAEKRQLGGKPKPGHLAKLAFVAKEATLKAVLPFAGQPLDFRDIQVDLAPAEDGFSAEVLASVEKFPSWMRCCAGRFARHDQIILAAVLVPNRGEPASGPERPFVGFHAMC
jgi:4'-phosphopantetheinyl transferase EntD